MGKLRTCLGSLMLVLTACGGFERQPIDPPPDAGLTPAPDAGWAGMPSRNILVRTVLDGDTIIVSANDTVRAPDGAPLDGERVRLLGIDAPEIAHNGDPADCWGDNAHEFTRSVRGPSRSNSRSCAAEISRSR